jgi:hypothetical protein
MGRPDRGRRPHNPIGWMFTPIAFFVLFADFSGE